MNAIINKIAKTMARATALLSRSKEIELGMLLLAVLSLSACRDSFLDQKPKGQYTAETFYSSDAAVRKGTEPLYNRAWFDFNRRAIVGMGSYRANDAWNPYVSAEFARFQVTALTQDMSLAWSALYNVVTMSNATLQNIENYCSDEVTEKEMKYYLSEREQGHFETWGDFNQVIILTSTLDVDETGGDGSFEPNRSYTGWKWILVRSEGGPWRHVDHGYG